MPDRKTKRPAPWAWPFAVACFAIPVLTIGGAIPTAIGVGGAFYCLAVSREAKKTTKRKLVHCMVVTTVCWALFAGLAGGVAVLQKRFPSLMHTKHTRPLSAIEKAKSSDVAQKASELHDQVQAAVTRLEEATLDVMEDEAARRKIYSRAIRMRSHLERAYERREDLEARGIDLTVTDKQIEHMKKMHEQSLDFATRFNKITREQLDQIIREGDRKGWPTE